MITTVLNNKAFFASSFILFVSYILLADFYFLFPIIIGYGLLLYYKKFEIVIYLVVLSFILLTSTINVNLRIVVQFGAVFTLLFFFLNKYGFDFLSYPIPPKFLTRIFLALLVLMFISTIFGNQVQYGMLQILRSIVFLTIMYLLYAITDGRILNWLIAAIISASLFLTAILMVKFVQHGFDYIAFSKYVMADQDYLNRNTIGGLLLISIMISISLIYSDKVFNKYLSITLTIILSIGLLLTNSRTSIVATSIGVMFILFIKNRKTFKIAISLISIAVLSLLIPDVFNLFSELLRLDRVLSGRDVLFQIAFEQIFDNILLGVGPGGTYFNYYSYNPFMLNSIGDMYYADLYHKISFGHAHSFYLFFFTDMGIFGLILAIVLPFSLITFSNKIYRHMRKRNSIEKHLFLGIHISIIAMFIRGIFEWGGIFSYGTLNRDIPFWILIVAVIYYYNTLKNRKPVIEKN